MGYFFLRFFVTWNRSIFAICSILLEALRDSPFVMMRFFFCMGFVAPRSISAVCSINAWKEDFGLLFFGSPIKSYLFPSGILSQIKDRMALYVDSNKFLPAYTLLDFSVSPFFALSDRNQGIERDI